MELSLYQRVRKWMIEKGWIRLSVKDWQTLYSSEEHELFAKKIEDEMNAFFKKMKGKSDV